MRQSMFALLFVFVSTSFATLGWANQPSGEIDTVYLHSREISLPQFQMNQLLEDRPFSDSLFDAGGNLWVIGKTSAWKWTIGEKALQKIKLTEPSEPLVSMEKSNGYLFVATNFHLFRIKFAPEEIIRFRHPANGKGNSGRLIAGQQTVWWVHDDGIAWFDTKGKLSHYPAVTSAGDAAPRSWFDPENRIYWVLDGQTLTKVDYRHTPPKMEKVHRARHPFANIHGDSGYVMVHTNHTIIRFDSSHNIKQIIPVAGPRQLIASDINSKIHTYFFSDKLLEIYDMDKQVRFQSRLPITARDRVNSLLTQGSYSVVISDGIPHLFSHEKNLNISSQDRSNAINKG